MGAAAAAPTFEQEHGNAAAQQQMAGSRDTSAEPDARLGAARIGAPTTKPQALARHERNVARIDRILRSAMAQSVDPTAGAGSRVNLLRNTAQWIDAGEANLYVMTPTHDSQFRPGVPADQNAYFDTRKKYNEAGADYDATRNGSGQAVNDVGLEKDFATVAGSMGTDGVTMMLMDPVSFSEGDIVGFFIHEVQHDADQHRSGEAWQVAAPAPDPAAVATAPQWAYNSYQSEFRAYWMMNPEGSTPDAFGSSTDLAVTNVPITAIAVGADGAVGGGDDTSKTVTTAFGNARQQDIFNHMFGGGRADGVYYDGTAWTQSYAYLPHYMALDPAFKSMVDGYTHPVSGNLINSVRIQLLSEAIATGGDWAAKLAALDDLDRNYLGDQSQSRPFWDQARAGLGAADFTTLETTILTGRVYGPFQTTATVVRGDTLSAIADRYLSDMSRWREIYTMNRSIIGANPDRLTAGLVLQLPAM